MTALSDCTTILDGGLVELSVEAHPSTGGYAGIRVLADKDPSDSGDAFLFCSRNDHSPYAEERSVHNIRFYFVTTEQLSGFRDALQMWVRVIDRELGSAS